MNFLFDENIGKEIAKSLRLLGHTTSRIREINPGIEDAKVLDLAIQKDSILITSDKDFGELIFKEKQHSLGVIFLRLKNQTSENKFKTIKYILSKIKIIRGKFIVITEKDGIFKVRIKSIPR